MCITKHPKPHGSGARGIPRRLLLCVCVFVACMIVFSSWWVGHYFGNVTMEGIIFQLSFPMEGVDISFVRRFILMCILPSVVGVAIYLCVALWVERRTFHVGDHALTARTIKKIIVVIPIVALVASFFFIPEDLKPIDYVKRIVNKSTFMEEQYVDAKMGGGVRFHSLTKNATSSTSFWSLWKTPICLRNWAEPIPRISCPN
jgi:hypothetical protein